MRLSKIKLAGFKSFVDPTSMKLPGNLTGIVGPNGCGKSNVIDGCAGSWARLRPSICAAVPWKT
jgi:chromosome segregation ATPase